MRVPWGRLDCRSCAWRDWGRRRQVRCWRSVPTQAAPAPPGRNRPSSWFTAPGPTGQAGTRSPDCSSAPAIWCSCHPTRSGACPATPPTSPPSSSSGPAGPVVLVGHSYGGAVITNAGATDPDVRALVYINGFAPDQGENVLQLANAQPGSELSGDPTTKFDFVVYPGAPSGDFDLYVKQAVFPHAFANDLPAGTGAVLAASQRPITLSGALEPSGPPAWKTIPSWYLVGRADNVIPPAEQRVMATRAGAKTVEINAGHLSMLSRPAAVTYLIESAACSVDCSACLPNSIP